MHSQSASSIEAAYKYPRQVEFVEEFPTTVTGKVQRRKLTE
ncbi:hypothetical protein [Halogeometricum salsisoli]|nr:hypothetical protein [Halogeometricum sp. S1BR25-6]